MYIYICEENITKTYHIFAKSLFHHLRFYEMNLDDDEDDVPFEICHDSCTNLYLYHILNFMVGAMK